MSGQEFLLLGYYIRSPSIETLLIAGSAGFKYAKQHLNSILDIVKKAEERREASGYAIYTNYKYVW